MELSRQLSGSALLSRLDDAIDISGKDSSVISPIREIIESLVFGDVQLEIFSAATSCANSILLVGMQDECQCGYMAACFVRDKLNLPLVAEITSRRFPQVCIISSGQSSGGCKIYGNAHICVAISEFRFEGTIAYDVLDATSHFSTLYHQRAIVLVEGVKEKLELPPGVPPPRTEADVIKLWTRLNMEREKSGTGRKLKYYTNNTAIAATLANSGAADVVGDCIISGISAGFISNANKRNVNSHGTSPPVLCLFGAFSPIIPDHSLSVSAVQLVFECLLSDSGVTIDLSTLKRESDETRSKMNEAIREISGSEARSGAAAGIPMSMYT